MAILPGNKRNYQQKNFGTPIRAQCMGAAVLDLLLDPIELPPLQKHIQRMSLNEEERALQLRKRARVRKCVVIANDLTENLSL